MSADIPNRGKNPVLQKLEEERKGTAVRLMIGTPCYGGMVTDGYLQSIFSLVNHAQEVGLPVVLVTMSNESLITRGRNEIVNTFLKSDATHLMFIDADISFDPRDVVDMLKANVDIVAGSYPLKAINWEGIQNLQRNKEVNATIEDIHKSAFHTVINVKKPSAEKIGQTETVQIVNGLIDVYDVGTGFMLMKKEVFAKMIEAYPETTYYFDKDLTLPKEERKRYALFDTMIDEDGRYLSEDYTFCRRWQKLGGKVHLAVNVKLNHTGTFTFIGQPIFTPKSN
jgi:hypothetical protein